jgi:hypothetical protein
VAEGRRAPALFAKALVHAGLVGNGSVPETDIYKSKERYMNVSDINSSVMSAMNNANDAASALVARAAARLSPHVTTNASPFDTAGKAMLERSLVVAATDVVADAALGDEEKSRLSTGWHRLSDAMAAIPLAGPALASLMSGIEQN